MFQRKHSLEWLLEGCVPLRKKNKDALKHEKIRKLALWLVEKASSF
jgi:hypothetical protein